HWAQILEQQKQSPFSIKQFCTEQSISYQTFHYWSKKLSAIDDKPIVQPVVFEDSPNGMVVLSFANGIRAELPISLNATQIKHWVEALQ
ncbi:IS66 family insertion sequence element accessory protein TnpA, partial [Vibrio breoganii]|uniref:IS66 family insertion sequence element accessory protein TnpA n=1 Tax=Vibrio breoganii TaxID=553239 RepID=UPI000C860150